MKAVLDTHAIIWVLDNDPRLGTKARQLVQGSQSSDLAISDMSLLEIALLIDRRKIPLTDPCNVFLQKVEQKFTVVPINPDIAADAVSLNLPQGDPFDRIITATARFLSTRLLTCDRKIIASQCATTLW